MPIVSTPTGEPTPDEIAEGALWRDAALRDDEYVRACELLGRRPTWTEASIVGVMWSEHCSYKSSRHLLRTLPTDGPHVLQGPGENAGVVDLGDGWAAAFKVESHNHPSAVEPYHGAATGVGGILRDVFTMGARPVAILDSLRFGSIEDDGSTNVHATRRLLAGVVEGIAGYGNCVGVPTVGGEVVFDPSYARNPLVNAMCIGVLRHDELQLGAATGTGNPVLYVGARTGRDGIHGATFASIEDPHGRERSAVQVGDPFREKLLIEACLELFATGTVVGVQDMGAAGLTSSSVEMAARAGSGIEMDLDRVPVRESGMAPFELMLSESQERMLVVVEAGTEHVAREIFERWELDCAEVGTVTDTNELVLRSGGDVVCRLPLAMLVDDLPERRWPVERDASRCSPLVLDDVPDVATGAAGAALLRLLGRPTIASKRWIHDQFDSMVGAATVVRPGSDAAVVKVIAGDTDRAIAASIDCNGRWCSLDPRAGAAHAVAEATRNVAVTGGRPLAVTDCLNFSSPEVPHVAWQLEEAVAGLGDACRALGTPVVSGNVSLYNRSGDVDIHPTPVVGAVGVVDDLDHVTRAAWTGAGSLVLLLGATDVALDGSEYLAAEHDLVAGGAPPLDLALETRVQACVLEAITAGLVRSAHDCSDGGIAVALAESAIAGSIGATLDLGALAVDGAGDALRTDELLFGEGASRIVLEIEPDRIEELAYVAARHDAPLTQLGRTGGDDLVITRDDEPLLRERVPDLAHAWTSALPTLMDQEPHA